MSEFFSPSTADVLLVTLSFVSSAFTAVVGLGGGVLLLSVMPGLMPTEALVPVHGVVQFASNGSRALFAETSIQWPSTISFSIGAILGAVVGSQFVVVVSPDQLFLYLGIFILVVTWTPFARIMRHLHGKFIALGFVQTFLSLFVGATGPLSPPVLASVGWKKDTIVATQAMFMTVMHLAKVMVFGFLGFVFRPYLPLLVSMTVATILGSWFGTRFRGRVSELWFLILFKTVVTLLALRMILNVGL